MLNRLRIIHRLFSKLYLLHSLHREQRVRIPGKIYSLRISDRAQRAGHLEHRNSIWFKRTEIGKNIEVAKK